MSVEPRWCLAVALALSSCRPSEALLEVPLPAPRAESSPSSSQVSHRSSSERLAFVPVDDASDVLARYADDEARQTLAIPSEIQFNVEHFRSEHVGWTDTHYAEIKPIHGETIDQALARGRAFLATVDIPRGEHFAFQSVPSFDSGDSMVPSSYHSLLLYDQPVITGRDVTEAVTRTTDDDPPRWEARLTLSSDGRDRFRRYTASHLGSRMAVVFDGLVKSAPMIAGEIGGGRVSISMGGQSLEDQRRDAEAICKVLGAGRR